MTNWTPLAFVFQRTAISAGPEIVTGHEPLVSDSIDFMVPNGHSKFAKALETALAIFAIQPDFLQSGIVHLVKRDAVRQDNPLVIGKILGDPLTYFLPQIPLVFAKVEDKNVAGLEVKLINTDFLNVR